MLMLTPQLTEEQESVLAECGFQGADCNRSVSLFEYQLLYSEKLGLAIRADMSSLDNENLDEFMGLVGFGVEYIHPDSIHEEYLKAIDEGMQPEVNYSSDESVFMLTSVDTYNGNLKYDIYPSISLEAVLECVKNYDIL
jgi:hypothetical protein